MWWKNVQTLNASARLAIVIIDMQWHFINWTGFAKRREQLIAAQKKAIRYAAAEDIPVVKVEYEDHGPTIAELEIELVDVPRKTNVLKPGPDGFAKTNLEEILRGFDAERVLLMGVQADICVWATALGAQKRGFQVLTSPHLIDNEGRSMTEETHRWYRDLDAYRELPFLPLIATKIDLVA